ncbi:MAG: hypothetical protein H0T73_00245 [Ardenticatenales bacterium]|nr:hypothetical protein [Ardenticatenales bacterium]
MVSLVLLGLALTPLIGLQTRIVQAELFGSPVTIPLSSQLIMAVLLYALTAVGVEYIVRGHEEFSQGPGHGSSYLFWIIPTLVTLAATWLTPLLATNLFAWLGGLTLAAIGLSAVVIAEYRTISLSDPLYTPARLFLNVVTYVSALVLFTAIYGSKLRSALSASSVAFLAGVLALALLRVGPTATVRTWAYAVICGLVLAEATWALNYWGVTGVAGGGLLVLIFYFFTGLSQQRLLGRFSRPVIIEFSIVGLLGLFLLVTQGALSW